MTKSYPRNDQEQSSPIYKHNTQSAASPPELELVLAAPSPHGVRFGYDEAAIPNGGLHLGRTCADRKSVV